MLGSKCVGVIGARALPASFQGQVSQVISYLLQKGYRINSGGALGADQFALQAVIAQGACAQSVIYSAWSLVTGFPRQVQASVEHFLLHGGSVVWGIVAPRSARHAVTVGLLARNLKLVQYSSGIVAFLYGESRGTLSTIRRAITHKKRVVVFLCGGSAVLPPAPAEGRWLPLHCSVSCWQGGFLYVKN